MQQTASPNSLEASETATLDAQNLWDVFRFEALPILAWLGLFLLAPLAQLYGSQTIGLAVSIATLLWVLRSKNIGYLLLFVWCTLVFSDSFQFSYAGQIKPVYMLLFSGMLLYNYRAFLAQNFLWNYMIPFFAWAGLVLFQSPELGYSAPKYVSYVLLYAAAPLWVWHAVRHEPAFFRNVFWVALGVVVASILYSRLTPHGFSHGGRLRGIFGNPNGLSMFCLFTAMFSVVLYDLKYIKFKKSWWFWLFIAPMGLALLMSGSRAGLFALLLFFGLRYLKRFAPLGGLAILLFMIFAFDYAILLITDIIRDLGYAKEFRLEGDQGLAKGSGRLIAWQYTWVEIQKAFYFGRGWAYDEIWIYGPIQKILNLLNHQGGVHNSYLIIWLNNGVIGLGLFLFGLIRSVLKAGRQSFLVYAVLYAALLQANAEPWLAASLNPYTIVFLMTLTVIAAGTSADNTKEEHAD